MSKKHFIALARQFHATLQGLPAFGPERKAAVAMVWATVMVCRAENPAFDSARFTSACGLTADE